MAIEALSRPGTARVRISERSFIFDGEKSVDQTAPENRTRIPAERSPVEVAASLNATAYCRPCTPPW